MRTLPGADTALHLTFELKDRYIFGEPNAMIYAMLEISTLLLKPDYMARNPISSRFLILLRRRSIERTSREPTCTSIELTLQKKRGDDHRMDMTCFHPGKMEYWRVNYLLNSNWHLMSAYNRKIKRSPKRAEESDNW
jgi:hypothetical protein